MTREERFDAHAVFLLLCFAYAYFFGGSGFNQNATFDLTRSLVERHRIDIDPYAANSGDVSFHGGHTYVNKAPGLSFLAAPVYALLRAVERAPAHDVFVANANLYVITVALCATSGALTGVLLYLIALRLGLTRRAAFVNSLTIGLATPLFAYSTMLYAHVPSALLMLAAFAWASGILPRRPLLAGAAIGLASTMNYLCIVVAAIDALLLLATSDRRLRDAGRYIAGGVPFAVALLAYQHAAFGSLFRTSIATMDQRYVTRGAWLGIVTAPDPAALWGLTFSPYRGLFFLAPVLLLAIPGAFLMARRRGQRASLIAIAGTSLFFLVFTVSFNGWFGGYAIGPRYLVPIIPLLAILMMFAAHRFRAAWLVTGAIALVFNVTATAVDPQPPQQIENPLFAYELPALVTGRPADDVDVPRWVRDHYTGHTSTSRVTVDDGRPFRRHPPGSPAVEWASFNIGELAFGPGSPLSLLPFLAAFALGTAFTLRRIGGGIRRGSAAPTTSRPATSESLPR